MTATTGELADRLVVVTRAEAKGNLIVTMLERLGAEVLSVPTIRFAPPANPGPITAALTRIKTAGTAAFHWILFTSSTGVESFFKRAGELGIPRSTWSDFRFAVVGPTTASMLASVGIKSGRVVIGSKADTLGNVLVNPDAPEINAGERCLVPQANIARSDVQDILIAGGVEVESVTAYQTLSEEKEKAAPFLEAVATERHVDALTFASPSAFENFLAMTDPVGERVMRETGVPLFSIGPTTSQAIQERGFTVAAQASPHTTRGLVHAIAEYLNTGGSSKP